MKLINFLLMSFVLADISTFAQKPFTLKECIVYSESNNTNIKVAAYNVEISKMKVTEQIGAYLPQIDAFGTLDDNLKLSTQLMPAEMMGGTPGTYIPVKFGNKYSVNGGVQFTQKIFDPSNLLLIKSAKMNKDISLLSKQQTDELAAYNICVSYYSALVIQLQMNALKTTLLASDKSLKSIQLKFDNGMARKVDVDKIMVSYNNTKSQLEQAVLSYSQSLNSLKYYMGMPVDSVISLADTTMNISFESLAKDTSVSFQLDNIIDYRIKQSNISLMELDRKTKKTAFLPSLSFYGNYNYNAMRQEFNFFDPEKDWFPSSGIGFKQTIPIFDGLQRNSKLAQLNLNIKILTENLKQSEQLIKLDISNYEIQYKNAIDNIIRENENLDLAKNVFENSQIEYQQGNGSALDLIQSESSFLVAQSNYYNKLLNLYIARIVLEKAKGTLMSFINNLK